MANKTVDSTNRGKNHNVGGKNHKAIVTALGTLTLATAVGAFFWLKEPLSHWNNKTSTQTAEADEPASTSHRQASDDQFAKETQRDSNRTRPAIPTKASPSDDLKNEQDLFRKLAEEEGLPLFAQETDYDVNDSTPVVGTLVSGVIKQGNTDQASDQSITGDSFRFPEVVTTENGDTVMVIGDQPIPNRSVHREVAHGKGAEGKAGDTIHFRYDMFSWATGELVESSNQFEGEALTLTLGDFVNGTQVPRYLHNALLNRSEGTKMQVIFEQSLEGLPAQMNPHDGYVLMVEIDRVVPRVEEDS